ncbi:MAG: IgGFc-binding protein, partial [Bacteroidales bacterium]|nr:IgGFc-binding protein [Bacteroidales bacterium]
MKNGRNIKQMDKLRHWLARIAVVAFLFLSLGVSAQSRLTTFGTEFWATFLPNPNPGSPDTLLQCTLHLLAKNSPCIVNIENPATGWVGSYNVSNTVPTMVQPPQSECYLRSPSSMGQNVGLKIYSSDTFMVCASNFGYASVGVAQLLSQEALGCEYVVQSFPPTVYQSRAYLSSLAVVATQDNTVVELRPEVPMYGSTLIPALQRFTATLNSGQVLFLRSDSSSAHDISGTVVRSLNCKKIALFCGNEKAVIPDTQTADHIFEQVHPPRFAGKRYVATNTMISSSEYSKCNYVRFSALYDTTVLYKNGVVLDTLIGVGATFEDTLERLSSSVPASACYEATYPVEAFQYSVGSVINLGPGDPSMVWLAPVEMMADSMAFFALPNQSIRPLYGSYTSFFLNVVVPTADTGNLKMDGTVFSMVRPFSHWQTVAGDTSLSYCVKRLQQNASIAHRLSGARCNA